MKILIIIGLAVSFCVGCTRVIRAVAFFPNKTDTIIAGQSLPPDTRPLRITTPDNEKLSCYYLTAPSNKVMIYYHGNAQNIDMRLKELQRLRDLGINVLGVGYRGYGKSTGKPSETGICSDGEAALKFAMDTLGFAMEDIFLCGRSIGTAVAINTAQYKNIGGVILITPLSTGREFAKSHHIGFLSWFLGNPFDNLSKCVNIKAPVLVIHGTEDRTIPYALGKSLFKALPVDKTFITIPKAGHNDLENVGPKDYWDAIQAFLNDHGNQIIRGCPSRTTKH